MNTKIIDVISALAKAEDNINQQITNLSFKGEEATLILDDNLVTVTVRKPSQREKEIFTIYNVVPKSITTNTMLSALYELGEEDTPPNYLCCILRDYISSVYDLSLEVNLPRSGLLVDDLPVLYKYLVDKYMIPVTFTGYGPFYHDGL